MGWGMGGKGSGGWASIRDPEKTVWLGQVPTGTTFQQLLEVGNQHGTAKWAKMIGSANAAIGYATTEEAAAAVQGLNGAVVNGAAVVSDAWAKKSGGAGGKGAGGDGAGGVKKPMFQKSWGGGWDKGWGKGWPMMMWGMPGMMDWGMKGWGKGQHKNGDPAKMIWLGNVPEGTEYKVLLDMGKQVGGAKWARVFKNGTAAMCFGTKEEAAAAATAMSGAQVGNATLEADLWEKSKKKEAKA